MQDKPTQRHSYTTRNILPAHGYVVSSILTTLYVLSMDACMHGTHNTERKADTEVSCTTTSADAGYQLGVEASLSWCLLLLSRSPAHTCKADATAPSELSVLQAALRSCAERQQQQQQAKPFLISM